MKMATKGSAGGATSSGAPDLAQLAVDDHADLVGERRGILVVVRDEQGREPELAQQLLQLGPHRDLRVRVERRQRLVEQQDARVARSARASATRWRSPPDSSAGRAFARWRSRTARGARRPAARRRRRCSPHVHVREERVLLEHEAEPPLVRLEEDPRPGVEPDILAQRDPPGSRPDEPGDGAEHRRLARSRRPDERDRPSISSASSRSNDRRGRANSVVRLRRTPTLRIGGSRG